MTTAVNEDQLAEYKRLLHEQLRALQDDYDRRAAPIIRELMWIDAISPRTYQINDPDVVARFVEIASKPPL